MIHLVSPRCIEKTQIRYFHRQFEPDVNRLTIGSDPCQSKCDRIPALPPRKDVCFHSQAGEFVRAPLVGVPLFSLALEPQRLGVFPGASQVSRCFFLPWWRTCITSNPLETDCTPQGVADAATSGRGPSSWEHGTWCVKWLMDVSGASG